jgi:K+-transporting ATPase ATPase B chain
VFVIVVLTLNPIASYAASPVSIPVLVALLVCLIPTTIGALLSAIGIAGMDRLVQRNVLAMSGRAVEAAGDVTTLLLDKTGTITYGNRRASAFLPLTGVDGDELAAPPRCRRSPTRRPRASRSSSSPRAASRRRPGRRRRVPFTAQTRMSGLDLADGTASARAPAAPCSPGWSRPVRSRHRARAADIGHRVRLAVRRHPAGGRRSGCRGRACSASCT